MILVHFGTEVELGNVEVVRSVLLGNHIADLVGQVEEFLVFLDLLLVEGVYLLEPTQSSVFYLVSVVHCLVHQVVFLFVGIFLSFPSD